MTLKRIKYDIGFVFILQQIDQEIKIVFIPGLKEII